MNTKITYLGAATFIIEVGPFRFLTDPGFDPKGTEKSEGPPTDYLGGRSKIEKR